MDGRMEGIGDIRSNLIRRAIGGWLAIAPKGSALTILVTAESEEELCEKFRFVYNRWIEILKQKALFRRRAAIGDHSHGEAGNFPGHRAFDII